MQVLTDLMDKWILLWMDANNICKHEFPSRGHAVGSIDALLSGQWTGEKGDKCSLATRRTIALPPMEGKPMPVRLASHKFWEQYSMLDRSTVPPCLGNGYCSDYSIISEVHHNYLLCHLGTCPGTSLHPSTIHLEHWCRIACMHVTSALLPAAAACLPYQGAPDGLHAASAQ